MEEYIRRRNEARKMCRDKKREMINNEINLYLTAFNFFFVPRVRCLY